VLRAPAAPPGGRDRVARGLERLDGIPDRGLHVHLVGDGPDAGIAGVQVDGGGMLVAELLRTVGAQDRGDVLEAAVGPVILDGRRLGEHRQIGRRPALDAGPEDGLMAGADLVYDDVDAGRSLQRSQGGSEVLALAADPLGLDRDLGAVEGLVGAHRLIELGVAGRSGRGTTRVLRERAAGAGDCHRGGHESCQQGVLSRSGHDLLRGVPGVSRTSKGPTGRLPLTGVRRTRCGGLATSVASAPSSRSSRSVSRSSASASWERPLA